MQFRHEPVALILTRQALPTLDRTKYAAAEGVRRGAYVLADAGRQARSVAAGHRQRSRAVRRRLRATQAGGHQGARREHAVVGAVRAPLREHPEYREQVLPER